MAKITMNSETRVWLNASNYQGRRLEQYLEEVVDYADAIVLDHATMTIGGITFDALNCTLHRDGKQDIEITIHENDILCRHPQDPNKVLFRPENFVSSIVLPRARAAWGIE